MSTSTSVPIRWSRALSTLLAGLLAAAAVTAAGYAATALLSQTTDRTGAVCGSAWRFHTGSGTQVPAAELTSQQRARVSQECAQSGDADWQRGVRSGRLALGAAGAAIALAAWARFGPAGRVPSGRGPSRRGRAGRGPAGRRPSGRAAGRRPSGHALRRQPSARS